MKGFSLFEQQVGLEFNDKNLLTQAFLHRSYLNENPSVGIDHNERLEFLGDAVLELVITDYLFGTYKDKTEGELTAYRAALVNTISLARISQALGVNDFLLLSKGESKDTGKARQYILANTFEALIGAIYLDKGYKEAEGFIIKYLAPYMEEVINKRLWRDNKSHFQEKAQEHTGITPSYEVLNETGPDHDKRFIVGVFLGSAKVADGEGRSKQEAEQSAAANALSEKGWNS